jgi:hypothetical protein
MVSNHSHSTPDSPSFMQENRVKTLPPQERKRVMLKLQASHPPGDPSARDRGDIVRWTALSTDGGHSGPVFLTRKCYASGQGTPRTQRPGPAGEDTTRKWSSLRTASFLAPSASVEVCGFYPKSQGDWSKKKPLRDSRTHF